MPKTLVKPGQPRTAVVTGAGQGIGRAVAVELIRRGYSVIVTDIDEPAAIRTASEIGASAGYGLDVTDPEARTASSRCAPVRSRLWAPGSAMRVSCSKATRRP